MVTISAKEGFDVAMESNLFVILDTTLTKDLINEGYAREFVSKVQQMRKNNGYEVLDNINIYYDGNQDIKEAIDLFEDFIKEETLAQSIENVIDDSFEKQDLNGNMTGIRLEKNLMVIDKGLFRGSCFIIYKKIWMPHLWNFIKP